VRQTSHLPDAVFEENRIGTGADAQLFQQPVRENEYLYYSFPGLFTTAFAIGIIDVWFGKEDKARRRESGALVQLYTENL
jgi:hypothetical protein